MCYIPENKEKNALENNENASFEQKKKEIVSVSMNIEQPLNHTILVSTMTTTNHVLLFQLPLATIFNFFFMTIFSRNIPPQNSKTRIHFFRGFEETHFIVYFLYNSIKLKCITRSVLFCLRDTSYIIYDFRNTFCTFVGFIWNTLGSCSISFSYSIFIYRIFIVKQKETVGVKSVVAVITGLQQLYTFLQCKFIKFKFVFQIDTMSWEFNFLFQLDVLSKFDF
ncbi:hypothetical protein ACFFRR_001980 [Megaselia abdita]